MDDIEKHGTMMVAFSLACSFFNYLYQLFMGRLLSPEDYGVLFSLFSFFYILSVVSTTFETSITKFVSSFRAKNEWGRINYLWNFAMKKGLILGIIVFLVLAIVSPFISGFLNLQGNYLYPILLFSSFIFAFSLPVNYGVLRGLQRFLPFGFSSTAWAFFKFSFGVLLVAFGLGIVGGLSALFIASLLGFLITLIYLRDLPKWGNDAFEIKGIYSYSKLAFLAILSYAVLVSIDVVLVKHFLSPEIAGDYSALSVLGKIVLFAPSGIAIAMFPKTSELFEVGERHIAVLTKSVLFTLLLSLGVVLAYYLYPSFIVNTIFGNKYLFTTSYLARYGLAMALLALTGLLMNYLLSINKTKIAYSLAIAALLEIALIAMFHSTIGEVVNVMLACGVFSLALIGVYLMRETR